MGRGLRWEEEVSEWEGRRLCRGRRGWGWYGALGTGGGGIGEGMGMAREEVEWKGREDGRISVERDGWDW